MRASIGVTRAVTDLKRDLLLFDQLHVMGLDWMLDPGALPRGIPRLSPAAIADCEYLIDQGVLRHAPAFRRELADAVSARVAGEIPDAALERAHRKPWHGEPLSQLPAVQRADLLASSARHPAGSLSFDEALPAGGELVVAYAEQIFQPGAAVPVLRAPLSAHEWKLHTQTFIGPDRGPTPADAHVAEVVVRRLPTPGDEVPLADVLAFAQEPETRRQVETLRNWMARTALSTASPDELGLEVDSLLHDLRQHMQLADMKARDGAPRLMVSIPLEVIEELLHLRPAKALDALFGLRARRAERLEAELSAPGREFAYIARAQDTFEPH